MKTFKNIIDEQLLTEAIKIEDANQIIDLIKDKKLGVKMEPSWKEINHYDDDIMKDIVDNFGDVIQTLKDKGLSNVLTWVIQLIVSKARVEDVMRGIPKDYIIEIAKGKNKPWAKETKEWQDMLSKPYSSELWHTVEKKLQEEGQKHGKHNKGSGEIEEVKKVYDDGTWTLQIPSSWEGAKAASYYGKDGEKNPTHWCTRASKGYYDHYTENGPLYIIRNLKNGKAYQIAFMKNSVEFLDQDDIKGDEVAKGDLSSIPDELLSKIKFNGRSLKDYKHNFKDETIITNKKQIKNPTLSLRKAEWSNPIHVKDDVYKKIWNNYADINDKEPLKQYMINGKNNYEGQKHNGYYAAKYYYKENPNEYVLCTRRRGSTSSEYFRGTANIEGEIEDSNFDRKQKFRKLERYARDDFGQSKTHDRWNAQSDAHGELVDKYMSYERKWINIFNKLMVSKVNKVINKYMDGIYLGKVNVHNINSSTGAFLPISFDLIFQDDNGKSLVTLPYENRNGKISYSPDKESVYKEHDMFKLDLLNTLKDEAKANRMIKEINDTVNEVTKEYSKMAVKDKTGEYLRMKNRGYNKSNNPNAITLQYEECKYFNY